MVHRPKFHSKSTLKVRSNPILPLLGISLMILLGSMQMLNEDAKPIRERLENMDIDTAPENIDLQPSQSLKEKTSTRSGYDYPDLISYDDVLVIRNNNSAMSMQIADYFQAKRNITDTHICNISTSTSETVSRATFENEIRDPIENHIVNNGLLGTINYIVTTKGVPLRISPDANTWDRASVDSELTLILGPYQNGIGQAYWMNNPYFDPPTYQDFSRSSYGIFLVTRLTGYDFDDIKPLIDKPEISIGRKGTFVLDVDPGKDDGGGYQEGNDWMRNAAVSLTNKGFDVLLDETNTFLTNIENASGYCSWGSNDGHYPTNSLLNTGLENDGNGDGIPDNWYFYDDPGFGSCSRNDTEVRNGAWSVRITRSATGENASFTTQNYTVKPDTRYYAVGYGNLSSVSSDRGAHLQIRAFDLDGKVIKYYNGSARTGTTNNWVSFSQIRYEPLEGVTNISVGVALSKSSGTIFIDDIRFYEIKPHNAWLPGAIAETYVSTGGRSFNYGAQYGQSLVADLIRDGVTGVKGYVYEPFLDACAHPDIYLDAYTDGFNLAESYYMASSWLSWEDVVIGDPKVQPYEPDIVPDLSILPQNISFSDDLPREGDTIDITATFNNLGPTSVFNITVEFWVGDPFGGGDFLGSKIVDVDCFGSNATSIIWDTSGYAGFHNITVVLDAEDIYHEVNESNNVAKRTIAVHTGPPTADAGPDGSVDEDSLYNFDASNSTDNTSIANYTWDFDDGNFGWGVSPFHTYTSQGMYIVTLNVTNVFGLWDLDTVSINVSNVQPTADAGEDQSGNEGMEIEFNASASTDTPSDIGTLNYTWYFGDGKVGYEKIVTHAYLDNGPYTVTLEVRDDDSAMNVDTADVTVNNIAPYITPVPPQVLQEDTLFTLQINASDVPEDTITFSDNSSMFDIDPVTGEISFTPRNEDVGEHTINITAGDEDGGESFIELMITVQNTNDPPLIVSTPITVAVEEALYQYDVVVEDDDLLVSPYEVIFYSLDSAPSGMDINSSGVITWVPTDFQASQTFNVIVNVTDDEEYDLQIFEITVTNINDGPVIFSTPITSAVEDSPYEYDVNASDVDIGDELTYSLDVAPPGMSINGTSGVVSWLPTNDFVGDNEVIVNVTDSNDVFDTQQFTIRVQNTNDAPILKPIGELTATEDQIFYYQVVATDVDLDDVLTFSDDSSLFNIDKNTGEISFTPSNNEVGKYTLKITVKDFERDQDSETITFKVLNVNDPPTLHHIYDCELKEDLPFNLTIAASDIDIGDSLTFQDDTTLFDIDADTGEISFTPLNEDVGVHVINISVADENGSIAYQKVRFIIENVNDPPNITHIENQTIAVGVLYNQKVEAFDVDAGDTLTFEDDTHLFDINPDTGEISFTPKSKDAGTHYVNISVTDAKGETDRMTVTFEIIGEEDKEEGFDLMWFLLLVIVVVIVVLILIIVVFMGRRRAKPSVDWEIFDKEAEDTSGSDEEILEFEVFEESESEQ